MLRSQTPMCLQSPGLLLKKGHIIFPMSPKQFIGLLFLNVVNVIVIIIHKNVGGTEV